MKRILFSFAWLIFSISLVGQEVTGAVYSKDYYLEKIKTQKTIGKVMLWGGLAMLITGVATYDEGPMFNLGTPPPEENNTVSNILIYTGLGAMAVSIPVLLSARHNKKRPHQLQLKIKVYFVPADWVWPQPGSPP